MLREVSVVAARVASISPKLFRSLPWIKKARLAPGFFRGTVIALDQSSSP
jgi:hypothetical protein